MMEPFKSSQKCFKTIVAWKGPKHTFMIIHPGMFWNDCPKNCCPKKFAILFLQVGKDLQKRNEGELKWTKNFLEIKKKY